MKRKKLILYYVIILAVIICGFFVGTRKKIENHGYTYYYGEPKAHKSVDGSTQFWRDSESIGDSTQTTYICWYNIVLNDSHKYFKGSGQASIELDYDAMKELMPITEISQLSKEDFNRIHYGNLILVIIIYIVLIGFPFALSVVLKHKKKRTGKKKIKNLKELAEMKELGLITEEEFEAKKKEFLGL